MLERDAWGEHSLKQNTDGIHWSTRDINNHYVSPFQKQNDVHSRPWIPQLYCKILFYLFLYLVPMKWAGNECYFTRQKTEAQRHQVAVESRTELKSSDSKLSYANDAQNQKIKSHPGREEMFQDVPRWF